MAYILIYLYFAVSLFTSDRLSEKLDRYNWIIAFFTISIFVGLRSNIGPDWESYVRLYELYSAEPLSISSAISDDLFFVLITKFSSAFDLGVYGTNFISALVFLIGLMSLCSIFPYKWASLLVALAVYIIPIGMGTVRQSVALGFYFFALVMLRSNYIKSYYFSLVLGFMSHKSIAPFALLSVGAFNFRTFIVLAFAVALIAVIIPEHGAATGIYSVYIVGAMGSSGVYYRILLCLMPSVILRFLIKPSMRSPLDIFNAFLIVFGVGMILVIPYAPALIDRFALYLSPLLIWSVGFGMQYLSKNMGGLISKFIAVTISAVLLSVWLIYSPNSSSWVPYCSILSGDYCD